MSKTIAFAAGPTIMKKAPLRNWRMKKKGNRLRCVNRKMNNAPDISPIDMNNLLSVMSDSTPQNHSNMNVLTAYTISKVPQSLMENPNERI